MTIRYGYFLRPSATMCAAQVEVHQLLKHQFGLEVAGRFMPHCTIKGFFKTEEPEDRIRSAAASITTGVKPFPVHSQGVVSRDSDIELSIMRMPDGSRNEPLQHLHQRALDALLPLVSNECNFSRVELLGDRFEAHLTLAMTDIPTAHSREIVQFCQELEPIGPESFTAEWLHLYAFESHDWHREWWRDFRWRLVDSWRLG